MLQRETWCVGSLNVYGLTYPDAIYKMLTDQQVDVLAVQEYPQDDGGFAEQAGYKLYGYAVNAWDEYPNGNGLTLNGVGLLVRSSHAVQREAHYYLDGKGVVAEADLPRPPDQSQRPSLALVELVGGLAIASVHMTWTPPATQTVEQALHVDNLLKELRVWSCLSQLTLLGDFNFDRATSPLYHTMVENGYDSHLPQEHESTLDPTHHYTQGKVKRVVDYLWTVGRGRSQLVVSNVAVCEGVSDHKAILAEIKYKV